MNKDELKKYAWLDAESVKNSRSNPREDPKQFKQFTQKMLDFLNF